VLTAIVVDALIGVCAQWGCRRGIWVRKGNANALPLANHQKIK